MLQVGELTAQVKQAAQEAGFDLAGVARVADFSELNYFPQWIADGYAGEMKYLEARDASGNLKRANLGRVAPWARSVIVCAMNYNTAEPYSIAGDHAHQGWISRYAWSQEDYHQAVMGRLRRVEAGLKDALAHDARQAFPKLGETPELRTRCYVDTGPLVERVYAKYAGIGWIGKNTCLLNQKIGSWLFLGVILTSIDLAADLPSPDRCGTCTRCIAACPTDALTEPYRLDSNRCISYLTIEKRGSITESMRDGMGRHVFGCDICQDVCPWNRRAPVSSAPEFQPREGLVNPALEWLAEMTEEGFRRQFRGSPVRRTKRSGMRRNAVVAMGNSGDPRFLSLLERLAADADAVLAEHARWARKKLLAGSVPQDQRQRG
ncbi:MAG TPA: tRNA epoxyqueuosine(34) reductase QueG [Terriglobales bacterium]|nr:tRNA epoxyqueuosine(34) reductase QueG [Terriglobales bacterium]